MKKEGKNQIIDSLIDDLRNNNHFYLTDISGLNVEKVNKLRRVCFKKNVKIKVVKNTLLKRAFESVGNSYEPLFETLKGSTSIMFTETGNVPAQIIKEFRKELDKPLLKGAFVEETVYIGDNQLEALFNIKSKNELIADIIALLQSPMKNVISGLQASGGQKIAGLVKTLSERSN